MPFESMHPTKRLLMQTVSSMLDSDHPYDVLVENVLKQSGVSKGSLYHHFKDYPELVEQTLAWRFSQGVDESIEMMRSVRDEASNPDEFWQGIEHLTLYSQAPERAKFRAERARIIGVAAANDRFGPMLAAEQDRMTNAITEIIRDVQTRGWVNTAVDPRALAVFIQSYTLGRTIDDIAGEHVSAEAWTNLIRSVTQAFRSN